MTAPMDTVVDDRNSYHYANNKISLCLPRGVQLEGADTSESYFISISLDEAEMLSRRSTSETKYFCIDIANGHMIRLMNVIDLMKKNCPNFKLIVGNIGNPDTYAILAGKGVWGVRVGIGGGASCTTSANTGVHFPYASLIEECYYIKRSMNFTTKIISDGGMRKFADIIKALALGADIVMMGSMFNKSLQSCADVYLWKTFRIRNTKLAKWLLKHNFKLYNKFRGMSTKDVQRKWNRPELRTAEGISKWNRVEYDLYSWVENFTDYLKSAMSYTNSFNLNEFHGKRIEMLTENAFKRFNK